MKDQSNKRRALFLRLLASVARLLLIWFNPNYANSSRWKSMRYRLQDATSSSKQRNYCDDCPSAIRKSHLHHSNVVGTELVMYLQEWTTTYHSWKQLPRLEFCQHTLSQCKQLSSLSNKGFKIWTEMAKAGQQDLANWNARMKHFYT